jgi:hypothetical protein
VYDWLIPRAQAVWERSRNIIRSEQVRDRYSEQRLRQFLRIFQQLFPPNAGYGHDCMRLRTELSASAKAHEPANADAHLTFMSAGLQNCVTYTNRSPVPIYFIDLDGLSPHARRTRRTTMLLYNRTYSE